MITSPFLLIPFYSYLLLVPYYSYLRASIGFNLAAFMAGTRPKIIPMAEVKPNDKKIAQIGI
jgi:hypothetical protein